MNGFVFLRRARIALLFFLVLICLAWATLFAIFLSHEWPHSPLLQKILIVFLLSLYVFTAILLYLMAVLESRHLCPWWDVVRMFGLLVVHIGYSVLFTHYKPSFPCLGYDTETECKDFVFIIFVGCWAFSGTTLGVAIALAVMAFIPRPVEPEAVLESLPLARTEEDVSPSNPDWPKARNPTDKRRTSLSSIDTGLPVVTYDDGGELSGESDPNTSPVNSIHRQIITLEPPYLWHGFQRRNSRHGNENHTRDGTIPTRNVSLGSTNIGSIPQHADPFSRKFFSYSPSPRVPIYSRASKTRPAVGGKNPPAAKVRPNRTSTFPKPLRDASSPIPLRNSPSLVTMPRDHATEYTPTVFSVPNNNSVPTPPWADSPPTYPDHARTTTPNASPSHSAPANSLSIEVQPTPYALLPSVPTPDVARFQDPSAFWGPKDISSGNNASFATGGSNSPLMPSVSQPRRAVLHSGVSTAHRASMPPVPEVPFLRRGSDGQVLDQTQWWGLVKNAATKH